MTVVASHISRLICPVCAGLVVGIAVVWLELLARSAG